jgi:hypothetical protein
MTTTLQSLRRDYSAGFLRYLHRRDEEPLRIGYEIGRAAVVSGMSVLELAQIHHEVLLEVLRDPSSDDLAAVATAASEFFLEVLATFDMTQRSLPRTTGSRATGVGASPRRDDVGGHPAAW